MYKPDQGEELFNIKPVGVRYKCPHCGKGEMKVSSKIPVNPDGMDMYLYRHNCIKCNGELLLPKIYPYIEWIPEEEWEDLKNDAT